MYVEGAVQRFFFTGQKERMPPRRKKMLQEKGLDP
jgi:hypothetical protein